MPKFVYCFSDVETGRFGAVELMCEKMTTLQSPDLAIVAKSISIKVLDDQITDVVELLGKNKQLKTIMSSAEKRLQDEIKISNIWI